MDDVRKSLDTVNQTFAKQQQQFDDLQTYHTSWQEQVLLLSFEQSVNAAVGDNHMSVRRQGLDLLRFVLKECLSMASVTQTHGKLVTWVSESKVVPTLNPEERELQVAVVDAIIQALGGVISRMMGMLELMHEFANSLKTWRDYLEVESKNYDWSLSSAWPPTTDRMELKDYMSAHSDIDIIIAKFMERCHMCEILCVHAGSKVVTLTDLRKTMAEMESGSDVLKSESIWSKHIEDAKVALSNIEEHVKECYPQLSQPSGWSELYAVALRKMLVRLEATTMVHISGEQVQRALREWSGSGWPF